MRQAAAKKCAAFGLSGALALSAVFAGLVSACYYPRFMPYQPFVSSVDLGITELTLEYEPGHLGMATLTATLVPNLPVREAMPIVWVTTDRNVIDFAWPPPAEISTGKFTSTATIIAWGPGTATVWIFVSGHSLEVTVTVEQALGTRESNLSLIRSPP